jgi:hypothetical protein
MLITKEDCITWTTKKLNSPKIPTMKMLLCVMTSQDLVSLFVNPAILHYLLLAKRRLTNIGRLDGGTNAVVACDL